MEIPTIEITLDDVKNEDVKQAILEKANDEFATGVIGPSFACSGPGSGWQKAYYITDYAYRALFDNEALYYLDLKDGTVAYLDDNNKMQWTKSPVVYFVCPEIEDAIDAPEDTAAMAKAVREIHGVVDEWEILIAKIQKLSEAFDMLARMES